MIAVGGVRAGTDRTAVLLGVTVVAALIVRVGVGGAAVAWSYPGALIFGVALLVPVVAAGAAIPLPRLRDIADGVAAGVFLIAVAALHRGALPTPSGLAAHLSTRMAMWVMVVAIVATAEEIALRGALFDVLARGRGAAAAVAVTGALFALIHLPLYGTAALPVDAAVGILLGTLRLRSSVWAPVTAHLLADIGGGLL